MKKEMLATIGFVVFVISLFIVMSTLENYGIDTIGTLAKGITNLIILVIIVAILVGIVKLAKHAKDIVIKVGRKTLDICTALDVILCTIILVVGFFKCSTEYGISVFMWWYVLGAVVVFLATLLANYTLYLLIDIRDSLKKLADKKGE